MNIYDISQKAGVSIATVSRVLNGSDRVSEKTRQKVLSVMNETGYTPNIFDKGLSSNSMQTIGILCANASDPYLANGVYYTERTLRQIGYNSLLSCTGHELKDKQYALDMLLKKRIDAVVMVGSHYIESNPENRQYIYDAAKQVPVIIFNGYIEHDNIYCSFSQDREAVSKAANYLLSQNRKHLLFLYTMLSYSGREKLYGFQKTLQTYGYSKKEIAALQCPVSVMETLEFLESLYPDTFPFDGIITSEDSVAIGALKFAQNRGIHVPEQLEIIGYNNSQLCVCCTPELTSIDNHLSTMCQNGVQNLIRVLKHEPISAATSIPCDLIFRGTTKKQYEIKQS